MDRIETTYNAINIMVMNHNKPRPEKFGGGYWNAVEEFEIYKKQVGDRYTQLQWTLIEWYFIKKFRGLQDNSSCEHLTTRKMFYMDKNKWVKTQYSYCKDCGRSLQQETVNEYIEKF